MSEKLSTINLDAIKDQIFTFRGQQVMVDRDLAMLYGVETRVLNQAVKRNIGRFPIEFMFQLTKKEFADWTSQIVISKKGQMGVRKAPHVFTEAGVSMLSGVLKSATAIKMSVEIIHAFVSMRKFIANNAGMLNRLNTLEQKQQITDTKLGQIFDAIEAKDIQPTEGIFFEGQVFDAYQFVAGLIKSARKSIVLIDNYVDESTLTLLSKRNKNCTATIYTNSIKKQLQLDLQKHKEQYPSIEIKTFKKAHDRFLILDETNIYHIGASLKDLGKKWFAFSKFEKGALEILGRLSHE